MKKKMYFLFLSNIYSRPYHYHFHILVEEKYIHNGMFSYKLIIWEITIENYFFLYVVFQEVSMSGFFTILHLLLLWIHVFLWMTAAPILIHRLTSRGIIYYSTSSFYASRLSFQTGSSTSPVLSLMCLWCRFGLELF